MGKFQKGVTFISISGTLCGAPKGDFVEVPKGDFVEVMPVCMEVAESVDSTYTHSFDMKLSVKLRQQHFVELIKLLLVELRYTVNVELVQLFVELIIVLK